MSKDSIQDKILPVMVIALIGAAFALGMMWGKVRVYEKGGALSDSVDSDSIVAEEEVQLDDEGQGALLENPAYAFGSDDADVTLVEFTDYECPFCKSYSDETMGSIVSDYVDTGKAKYVIRDLPLGFHSSAVSAAMAARCAGDEGKYLEMHDLIFDGQEKWSVGDADVVFEGYASELGLDAVAFGSCMDSEKYVDAVEADADLAAKYGASGTPSFFINGKMLVGAQPLDSFVEALEVALGN